LGLLVLAAGCGRVGFTALGDGSPHPHGDGGASDALSGDGGSGGSLALVTTGTAFLAPNGSTTATVTTAPVGAGHLLIIPIVIYASTASSIVSVTDNAGNNYVSGGALCSAGSGNNSVGTDVWYAKNTTAGATMVSVTFSANRGAVVWLLEVAGADPAAPLEASAKVQLPGAATAPAPSVSTTSAHAVVVSVIGTTNGNVTSLQNGSPFTMFPLQSGNDAAYDLVNAPGSYGAVWNEGAQSNDCASTAAFD
jgi:hypothetical protein